MRKTTLARISKLAIAIGFGVVICGAAVRPAFADNDRGDRHQEDRNGNRNRDHDRRGAYVAPAPDYYYAPAPNYYYAPEPSYYYPPQPVYSAPPPASEGISLFFGF